MSRRQRKARAEEHYEFITHLESHHQEIVDRSIKNTKIFGIQVGVPSPVYEQRYKETKIELQSCTTINAIFNSGTWGDKMTVLNFASAKHPGGGWLNGSMAQEESLALATTLYLPLSKTAKPMYDRNEMNPKLGFYNDLIVYSPDVLVFRDDDGEFIEKAFPIAVISVTAVNAGNVRDNVKKKRLDMNKMTARIKTVMESRCTAILKVAAKYDTEILILGAFGCGVFKNNPNDVAWMFKQLLSKTFAGVFKKVVFAIPQGDKNMESFEQIIH